MTHAEAEATPHPALFPETAIDSPPAAFAPPNPRLCEVSIKILTSGFLVDIRRSYAGPEQHAYQSWSGVKTALLVIESEIEAGA
jgi:hypothetical protein